MALGILANHSYISNCETRKCNLLKTFLQRKQKVQPESVCPAGSSSEPSFLWRRDAETGPSSCPCTPRVLAIILFQALVCGCPIRGPRNLSALCFQGRHVSAWAITFIASQELSMVELIFPTESPSAL